MRVKVHKSHIRGKTEGNKKWGSNPLTEMSAHLLTIVYFNWKNIIVGFAAGYNFVGLGDLKEMMKY